MARRGAAEVVHATPQVVAEAIDVHRLALAVFKNQVSVVKELLRTGTDVNVTG